MNKLCGASLLTVSLGTIRAHIFRYKVSDFLNVTKCGNPKKSNHDIEIIKGPCYIPSTVTPRLTLDSEVISAKS